MPHDARARMPCRHDFPRARAAEHTRTRSGRGTTKLQWNNTFLLCTRAVQREKDVRWPVPLEYDELQIPTLFHAKDINSSTKNESRSSPLALEFHETETPSDKMITAISLLFAEKCNVTMAISYCN